MLTAPNTEQRKQAKSSLPEVIKNQVLYMEPGFFDLATQKGLEPSTSAVTGRRSNQLSYCVKRTR